MGGAVRPGCVPPARPPAGILWLLLTCSLAGLLTCPLQAANVTTAYITITNTPAGLTSNLTVNIGAATTRAWTNDATAAPSLNIQTTNSTAASVTNAVTHFGAYPIYSAGVGSPEAVVDYTDTNTSVFAITAPLNTNITVTFGGNWARVHYVTNVLTDAGPIMWPTNSMSPRARTNAVNTIVNLLAATNMVPSNSIPPGAKALQNYTDNTSSQILSNKTLTQPVLDRPMISNAVAIRGIITAITNGLSTNMTLLAPKFTNAINYGNAFSSPGAGASSQQFGANAGANAMLSTALGNAATVDGVNGTALGRSSYVDGASGTAVGDSAEATNTASAFGAAARARGLASGAFGANTDALYDYSFGIGFDADPTTTNQVRIGGSTQTVSIPGALEAANIRDLLARGTNVIHGLLAYDTELTVTTVANGHNVIDSSSNTVIYITGAPSAGWTLGGFSGAKNDGRQLIVINQTGFDCTIANESGTAPTASDRILTYAGTGGVTNVIITGNGVMKFMYSTTSSRWILTAPAVDFTTFASLSTVAGGSSSNATVGGILYKTTAYPAFTNLNTTIATYTNAAQFILPAHALTNTGDSVITLWRGKLLAGTNALRLVYGYQTVLDTGSFTNTETAFEAGYEITRTGTVGAHADAWVKLVQSVGSLTSIVGGRVSTNTALTSTNGTAITNVLQVASNRAGAVSNNWMKVTWEPASR